ncbi:serine hydrolase [Kribbella deserti]|uniref:Serine hydrolase n=1 Tax=Kribbella deserti TaxID=1926257 RepID=A0ABV6QP22_9ACTN
MTRRPTINDLYDLALPEQPAAGPDGSIAYVLRTADREADRDRRALWLSPAEGEAVQLTRAGDDQAPAWSPDGQRIAFLRSAEGPAQLWILPVGGGEPEQVTTLPLGAGTPVWSPDGTRLAFAAPIDLLNPKDDDVPVVADRLDFKADGAGLIRGIRKHVHVLDLASRDVRQVTLGDWHAGDPAWSPDGTRLAFTAARDADADLTFRSAAYVVDANARTAQPELVGGTDWMLGTVGWTPHGEALLAVGRTDTEVGHAGLLRIPLDGGEVVDLAAGLDRNVMPGGPGYPGALPQVTADGRSVVFCVRDRGYTHLYEAGLDGSAPKCLVGGAQNVSGASVADGAVAIVLGTTTSYGEVATVDRASGEVTTRSTHGPSELDLFVHEEREFIISDGTVVHGWLLRDPAASGPRPLLVDIHGGPHNAWNGSADPVHLYHQALAERGWAILLLNPRASDGYGEAFFRGSLGAWGLSDAKDFLEPIDQLVAEQAVDAERLAVAGYSYGGFMTCYLTSRDQRFAAAVAGGVVADLSSMGGTSDAGHFLTAKELGEDVEAQSPFSRVRDVRTPTLIVQGGDDVRCPIGQAEQWFTALREQNVPTRLVLYPGGSHLFILSGKPSHRADWNQRVVDWVEQYAGVPGRPRRVPIDQAHWQRRLNELAETHRVPGATLGILRLGDEPVVAHSGVLNLATGVEVTADSVFQIGSITKVWTTTVVMQLVDEGKLDLDTPIAELLPELRLFDPEVTKRVTMRHLLTHTSGIDGDVFTDTGRGDDCLERYVDQLDQAAQNHPLGATFSYCNSGFNLAGRVIEKLTGQTWDQAMRERLFTPLGLTHTVTLPEEALMFRAAVGHVAEGNEDPKPAPLWSLPRSLGPAGLVTASAADVLAFARLHLTSGLGADGNRVLSEAAATEMTAKQADVPDQHTLGDSWGLGWIRMEWDGQRMYGHDGNTIGQSAFLRILPGHEFAVTLLTNGGHARDLYEDLYREVFAELTGVAMPRPLAPAAQPPKVDASAYLGTYERASMRMEVFESDGTLRLRRTMTGPLAAMLPDPAQEFELVAIDESTFVVREEGGLSWTPVVFYSLPTGEQYVHHGVRATPKVSG